MVLRNTVLFICLVAAVLDLHGQDLTGRGATVSGRVFDSAGLPVPDAQVRVFFFLGVRGSLPDAVTNSDGWFTLRLPPFGRGVVSAYDLSKGFPDAEMALYGRWAYPSVAPINATEGANIHVDLRFSPPDAVIEWTVVSKADHLPVAQARYRIRWSDDPTIMASSSISENGLLSFVLPKHPVIVSVTAPGFIDWNSSDKAAFGGPVLLAPGTIDRRVIVLDPK